MPDPAASPPTGSIAFDRAAEYYDRTRGLPSKVREAVADRIEQVAGLQARLLEIGVGTGRISLPLHRRGRRIFGVDLAAPMLGRYRANAAAEGLPAPAVVRADAARLPFRDGAFDAAIEVHVLHLVPRWRQAIAEARRVLAPGGVLVVARRRSLRSEGAGPGGLARARHAAILTAMGVSHGPVGVRGDAELIGALAELGGRVADLEPVTWQEDTTWAEQLEALERRVWSESWRIPEAQWQEAVRRLRAELDAEGVDLSAPQPAVRKQELTTVRF